MRKRVKVTTAQGEMVLVEMEEMGSYVAIVGKTLYVTAIMNNGSPDISAIGELTAPTKEDLALINEEFDTGFLMQDFSGR